MLRFAQSHPPRKNLMPKPPDCPSIPDPLKHKNPPLGQAHSDPGPCPAPSAPLSLPAVLIDAPDPEDEKLTRRGVLQAKRRTEAHRADAYKEYKPLQPGPEKQALHRQIQACAAEAQALERQLETHFVPLHGPGQLISPRTFFVSPLFHVRSKNLARQKHLELTLPTPVGHSVIRYEGPELRQCDSRVFLALLHMLRDVRVGTAVTLHAEPVCKALFGGYDGANRKRLRQHIQRLQKGLMIFEEFSVQLCLRFDYPKTGPWTVSLDPHIVQLFRISPEVWLSVEDRLSLPEGLATWLYAYIASQTRLIPMKLSTLRELCGSEASERGFLNRFRDAMHLLAQQGIIDTGWSIARGQVRWLKLRKSSSRGAPDAPATPTLAHGD
jgi:hypothetical protein